MLALHHAGRGQQHRERDRQRGEQRRADVAEQQEQHDDDQDRALDEVAARRCAIVASTSFVRLSTVLARMSGGSVCVDLAHLRVDRRRRRCGCSRRSASAPCRRRPPRRSRSRCRCAARGRCRPSATSRTWIGTPSRVADARSRAICSSVLDAAGGAHDVRLAVVLDVAGAGADVVALERLDHVVERQAVADELHRVGLHVILLHVAADRVDAGDALHALELRADDPVLHRAQVRGALDVVREPLALGREVASRRAASPARRRATAAPSPRGCSNSTVHM